MRPGLRRHAQGSRASLTLLVVLLVFGVLTPPLQGQDAGDLRAKYLLPVPPAPDDAVPLPSRTPWPVPSMGANSPLGFGAGWGVVWAAASYQDRVRYDDTNDAAAGVGFGLGDPFSLVGLQVGLISFSTVRSGFGNVGAIDLHLSRIFPGAVGLGAGWESAIQWGGGDVGPSRYAVVSKWFTLSPDENRPFSAMTLSVGVGDGRFQPEEDFLAAEDGIGVFGSTAVRVAAPLSVVADWTGQDLTLVGSVTPLREHAFVVSAGASDVTETAGDGARFILGMSYSYDFIRLR